MNSSPDAPGDPGHARSASAAADLSYFYDQAEAPAQSDLKKMLEKFGPVSLGLDQVHCERLQADLLNAPASERAAAWQSMEAVRNGQDFVDEVMKEAAAAEKRARDYIDSIMLTRASKSAAELDENETGARAFTVDTVTLNAWLNEIVQTRRQLEEERQTGISDRRAEEIDRDLSRLDARETGIKLHRGASQLAAAGQEQNRWMARIAAAMDEDLASTWRALVTTLLDMQRNRRRRNRRLRRVYAALLLGYAMLVVATGVLADEVIAGTPIAGLGTSLVLAFILFAVDRLIVAPRLDRRVRNGNLRMLKLEYLVCVQTLVQLRATQVDIDVMALGAGLPRRELLSDGFLLR